MKTTRIAVVALALVVAVPLRADDYFIQSDDYKEGEEIVGKFLQDADYAIMIEEITRNGDEFDWGWVKTPGWVPPGAPPPPEDPAAKKKGGMFKRGGKGSGPKTVRAPKELGFDLKSYKTVYIPPVQNFYGLKEKSLSEQARESFGLAMEALGLTVVQNASKADLELGLAIVDAKNEGTFAVVARIDPFIEIELRLRDLKSGENLVLLRNQAHSNSSAEAATRFATVFAHFME
jgi:hypothetical protein